MRERDARARALAVWAVISLPAGRQAKLKPAKVDVNYSLASLSEARARANQLISMCALWPVVGAPPPDDQFVQPNDGNRAHESQCSARSRDPTIRRGAGALVCPQPSSAIDGKALVLEEEEIDGCCWLAGWLLVCLSACRRIGSLERLEGHWRGRLREKENVRPAAKFGAFPPSVSQIHKHTNTILEAKLGLW